MIFSTLSTNNLFLLASSEISEYGLTFCMNKWYSLFNFSAVDLNNTQLSWGFVNWRKDVIAITIAAVIRDIACTISLSSPNTAALAREITKDKIIIEPFADLKPIRLFTALFSYH